MAAFLGQRIGCALADAARWRTRAITDDLASQRGLYGHAAGIGAGN